MENYSETKQTNNGEICKIMSNAVHYSNYITVKYCTILSNAVHYSNVQCTQYYIYIHYSDIVESDITHIPDQTPHWTYSLDPA